MCKKQSWLLIGILFICCICTSNISWGQDSKQAQEKKIEKRLSKVSSATKLDVHRFMGYEFLLPKYISLPYDASMNTNVRGPLFDISYLLLLFLPILLLFSIRKNLFRVLIIFILSIVYCISSITGYSASKRITQNEVQKVVSEELVKLKEGSDYLSLLKVTISKTIYNISKPILDGINNLSGKGDSITYPFMLVLFLILSLFFLNEHKVLNYKKWYLLFFMLVYAFYWWILSAGIVYYGMLFIPIGLLLIVLVDQQMKDSNRVVHFSFVMLTVFSIISSISFRLANYNPEMGGRMLHPVAMTYGLGKVDRINAINLTYPNFSTVLERINKDQSELIYKAGTFFHYFIDNNDIRVLEDNQLDKIYRLQQKYIYQGNEEVLNAFKRSGYKYLLVDLNLLNVDTSPERNLLKKINKLNELLGSTSIRLIGTDRYMEDGNGKSVYTVYGKRLLRRGTFAAFEII